MYKQDDFYTAAQAAKKFGVDRRTISRWVAAGKIEAVFTAGGHIRILRSEIENLLGKKGFSGNTTHRKTILIVDDEASVRRTLKKKLIREGFTVETAPDGFSAGLKARDIKPNLIILDLMMNGIDGFEVCKTIKSNDALRRTKILVMTGFDTPENRERAMREGADGYMPKEISFENILKCIHDLFIT
jgi:excisionase family DNA binding protein